MLMNVLSKTQKLLNDCDFEFYLTGSRYFQTHKETSDWDFFVEDNQEVRKYLSDFTEVCKECRYHDPGITMVVWDKDNTHIQLVRNAKLKNQIQQKLFPLMQALNLTKDQARLLWKIAYQLVGLK